MLPFSLVQQLQKDSLSSSLGQEGEEFMSDNPEEGERENGEDYSQTGVDPLDNPSENSTEDKDQDGDDPDWKCLEDEAENDDGGDDEEKDNPLGRNTIK